MARLAAATVAGGTLNVDGARAGTDATYGSGRSLEFVATFGGAHRSSTSASASTTTAPLGDVQHQGRRHASTPGRTRAAPARDGATEQLARLAAPLPDRVGCDRGPVLHRRQPGRHARRCDGFGATQMRPLASDLNTGGSELSVDWLRMSPYPASGHFDSRVFDAGEQRRLGWRSPGPPTTPAGTGVALSVRTGEHADARRQLERLHPDRELSGERSPAARATSSTGPSSPRAIRPRRRRCRRSRSRTPRAIDTTPPTITERDAGAGGDRRPARTPTSRSSSASRWTRPRSTPRPSGCARQGAGSDVPASVSYARATRQRSTPTRTSRPTPSTR